MNPTVNEFFMIDRELNIFFVLTSQSYFKVTKYIRLNPTHFFIMEIPNDREL